MALVSTSGWRLADARYTILIIGVFDIHSRVVGFRWPESCHVITGLAFAFGPCSLRMESNSRNSAEDLSVYCLSKLYIDILPPNTTLNPQANSLLSVQRAEHSIGSTFPSIFVLQLLISSRNREIDMPTRIFINKTKSYHTFADERHICSTGQVVLTAILWDYKFAIHYICHLGGNLLTCAHHPVWSEAWEMPVGDYYRGCIYQYYTPIRIRMESDVLGRKSTTLSDPITFVNLSSLVTKVKMTYHMVTCLRKYLRLSRQRTRHRHMFSHSGIQLN